MRFHVGFSFRLKDLKKIIIPILIAVAVFFGLKDVNAQTVPSVLRGYKETSTNQVSFPVVWNKNVPIVTTPTNLPIKIVDNTGTQFSNYYIRGFSLNFNSPITGNGKSYTINARVRIKATGMEFGSNVIRSLTPNLLFEQGSSDIKDSVTSYNYNMVISGTNIYHDFTLSSIVNFNDSHDLSTIYLSLYNDNEFDGSSFDNFYFMTCAMGTGGCSSSTFNATVELLDVDVTISNDLNETLLNGINNSIDNQTNIIQNNQQQTIGKLDELKDKFEDMFNSCSLKKELFYYPSDVVVQDYYLSSDGNHVVDVGSGITNYISVLSDTTYNIVPTSDALNLASFCLYDSSKNLISCEQFKKRTNITFNTNKAKYIRITITSTNARPLTLSHNVCKNKIDSTNDRLDDIENTITDDSIDDNSGFFTDFEENDFGLSDIVKAPLILIRGLSNGGTCQDLQFNVLGADVSLPSGCILWDKVPASIETIYNIFIGGFLAYILGTKLFHDVNDLKDPQKNEVSTLDL